MIRSTVLVTVFAVLLSWNASAEPLWRVQPAPFTYQAHQYTIVRDQADVIVRVAEYRENQSDAAWTSELAAVARAYTGCSLSDEHFVRQWEGWHTYSAHIQCAPSKDS